MDLAYAIMETDKYQDLQVSQQVGDSRGLMSQELGDPVIEDKVWGQEKSDVLAQSLRKAELLLMNLFVEFRTSIDWVSPT